MKSNLLIIGILIVIISALITLNIFFQQSLQIEMAEQFNKQQLVIAKSAAIDMEMCIKNQKEELLSLALLLPNVMQKNSTQLKEELGEYFKRKQGFKANVTVFDIKGNIIFMRQKEDSQASELKKEINRVFSLLPGQYIIGHNEHAVYMATPVYNLNVLSGAVLFDTHINTVVDRFLSHIKPDEGGSAWVIDNTGTLLYHPAYPEMVGRNIYKADSTCFKCHLSFNLEKKIIEGKAANYGRYIAASGEDKIIAFSTVDLKDFSWIIAVSAPYSKVTHATRQSMRLYSYLIISIFATTSIISALLIIFNKKRIQAEEIAKREQELEKLALILESKVRERTAELVSEKEKLNSIVSAIGGGIILVDTSAKILWANQMIKDMFGMDVVGKYCEELWADCDISGSHVKDNIETIILSTFWGQKNKYFQITTAPVKGEDGEIHGYIRLIQDVTEIKKMEEQMQQSEKLAAIGRLAAGIAHEIGNPLTSIFSFVQILREMEKDEFKKESLDTIYFHINRISEILKQLSGFSKMPVGESKRCQVNEVIELAVSLIQYDKKAKNINFVKELSSTLPEVMIDCNQLSQVFVNLILNAIDAMQEGGTLSIKSMSKDNAIIIQFEDTGIGIPKEDLNRIFDPFYTTKEKGTGLGLAVSYDIIKKMNGTLSVESELGKGSVFTITLPLNK